MAATLDILFIDTPPSDPTPLRNVIFQAFQDWTRHFDYTTGSYTIDVSFQAASQPADVLLTYPSANIPSFVGYNVSTNDVFVGPHGPGQYAQRLGLALTGRSTGPVDPGTLFINPGYLDGSRSPENAVAPVERELGHQLGIRSLRGNLFLSFSGSSAAQTGLKVSVYDSNVKYVTFQPDYVTTFNGPNATAVYGGPVPVVGADPGTTTVGGGRTVTTTMEGARTLQPLDIALLRDAGLPALTDQELGEHQIARLYVAAFGRNADSAGLIAQYSGLRAGLTLYQLGDAFVALAEFSNRYGTLSDAGFINALYQNVLARAPDAPGAAFYLGVLSQGVSRGTLLAAFADSDEERGRLNGDPNVTYAASAEAQVARVYDAAFGRDTDPGGFNAYTKAVINGASLQTVALSFLASPEFASHYGATPADQALVDSFYQNTLHRAPDAAGEAQYLRALASGTFSRADLLAAFADSQEHIGILAQRTAARDASGYNLDLLPHLGLIPVISAPVAA